MQRKLIIAAALCLLLSARIASAAIASTAVWEVRPTNGSNSNSGCYDPAVAGGTDYTQQNAVQYNFTDLASSNGTNASPSVTSASHSFVAADAGNCIHVSAGTNWTTGWYEIKSVAAGAATLDRAVGTSASLSGGTWFEGGALQTLGQLNTNMVSQNTAWVKAESGISAGANITVGSAGSSGNFLPAITGYTTTRGDGGQVTITATSTGYTVLTLGGNNGTTLANFIINCASKTNCTGLQISGAFNTAQNIVVQNATVSSIQFSNQDTLCRNCYATGQSASSGGGVFNFSTAAAQSCVYCVAYSNTVNDAQFKLASGGSMICLYCVAANATGGSNTVGFSLNLANFGMLNHSIAYNMASDGIRITSLSSPTVFTLDNTVSYGNGGFGITCSGCSSTLQGGTMNYNAYGGNTSGNLHLVTAGGGDITLSADPFVAGASNNFALSAGGVAAIGGKGFPGVLSVGGTGYSDIGTLEHQGATGTRGFPILH